MSSLYRAELNVGASVIKYTYRRRKKEGGRSCKCVSGMAESSILMLLFFFILHCCIVLDYNHCGSEEVAFDKLF